MRTTGIIERPQAFGITPNGGLAARSWWIWTGSWGILTWTFASHTRSTCTIIWSRQTLSPIRRTSTSEDDGIDCFLFGRLIGNCICMTRANKLFSSFISQLIYPLHYVLKYDSKVLLDCFRRGEPSTDLFVFDSNLAPFIWQIQLK